jgi:hypothetical protein
MLAYHFVVFWFSPVSVLSALGTGWLVMFFAKKDNTNVRTAALLSGISVAIFTASLSVSLINMGVRS